MLAILWLAAEMGRVANSKSITSEGNNGVRGSEGTPECWPKTAVAREQNVIEGGVIIAFDQHVFQSSVAMATPSRFADLSRQEIAGFVQVYTTLEYNPTIIVKEIAKTANHMM